MHSITQKQKAYLIVFAAFAIGVLAGASGQYLRMSQPASTTNYTVGALTAELTETLHLDPEQKVQVEAALKESKQQYQNVKDQMRPQMHGIRDATRKRIREMLTEAQKPRFDQFTRDLDARREREKKAAEENNK